MAWYLESIYLIPPIILAYDLREASLNVSVLAIFRSIYLSYEKLALGKTLNYEGYFRGLVLISAVFLLFYYGLPKRHHIASISLYVAFLAFYPRYIPAIVSVMAILARPFLKRFIFEPLINATFIGSPMLIALSTLLRDIYTIGVTIALFGYFLLLIIPVKRLSFLYSRLLLALFLSIYLYELIPGGYYVIAKSLIRPSIIGSEAIWCSVVTKRSEFYAIYVATYGLTIYTLYGEPLIIFLAGILIFVFASVVTALIQEYMSEL